MKYIIPSLLLLLSINCFSQEEFNVSYLRINQNLEFEQPIRFKMDAIQLGYTYWTDYNIGLKIALARSTNTPNSVILDKKYENKINALWKAQIVYRERYSNNLSYISGVGITEYHSTWKVDGKEPSWSKGTDSHKPSWFVGVQYQINKDILIESVYSLEYEKHKEGYGDETTESFSIGFSYIF